MSRPIDMRSVRSWK